MNRLLAYLQVLAGGFITMTGAAFVLMYIWEAIISRIGDADQSLLYWYLPILFIGIFAVASGSTLLAGGRKKLKSGL